MNVHRHDARHAMIAVDHQAADKLARIAPRTPARQPEPNRPDRPDLPALSPEAVVRVIHMERRLRWQERRVAVTVALPRAIVGRRVADGLTAFPLRFGLVAFVGLAMLTDLGLHGAVTMTVCGIVMGAGIGLALMKGATGETVSSRGRAERGGDGIVVEQCVDAGVSLSGRDPLDRPDALWRQQDGTIRRRPRAHRRGTRGPRGTRRRR